MSSGGPLAPIMLLGEAAAFARFEKFALAANCPLPKRKEGSEDPVKITKECLECLQKLTPEQVNEIHTKVLSSKKDIPYFPNEDTDWLGGNPFDNVKKVKYEGVNDVMMTSNSNEAAVMVAAGLHKLYPPLKGECKKLTLDQLMEEMKKMAGSAGGSQMSQMQMMLPMMFRSVDKNNPVAVRERVISLASDGMFFCLDLQFIAGFCKNKGKHLYFLRFDMRPSKSYYAPWLTGSQHGDELQYVWGFPLDPANKDHYDAHEKDVSDKMITFFADFAKHGNPVKHLKITWHPMHDKKRTYMNINEKEIKEHKKVPKNCCNDLNRYYGMGRSFLKNYKP
ncbi:acetylcholinesterase-like protein [Leptotrombidium deliense]|uniref:Acetylcholinesterase-like protein n=1 Tax=Leptotrombidium deliense TaxID=299467 RepID=A0A443SRS2_9ACAR|nr:acetylcholinesterase-like protein [Leptotrombidium deliense]